MRVGDANHKIVDGVLEVTTVYPSGNIAINCDVVASALVAGVSTISARNEMSGFEWEGSIRDMLEISECHEGQAGLFYLLSQPCPA